MDVKEMVLIDISHLGDYDAMLVMRSKTKELAFVMRDDMPEEAFIQSCVALRKLVFDADEVSGS